MLVELGLVEQRYKAVMEVLDGATVIDVARRNGVVRMFSSMTCHRRSAAGASGAATLQIPVGSMGRVPVGAAERDPNYQVMAPDSGRCTGDTVSQ